MFRESLERRLDWAPLRAVGEVCCALAVALLIGVFLARAALSSFGSLLPSEDPTMDISGYSRVGSQAAGELQSQGERSLGLFLGSSTTECAFDPREVSRADAEHRRWGNLHGPGPDASDVAALAQLAYRLGLRPEVLIVGLNPGMLASSREWLADEPRFDAAPLLFHIGQMNLGLVNRDLATLLRVPVQRALPLGRRVSSAVRLEVLKARLNLFEYLEVDVARLFDAAHPSWVEPAWAAAEATPRSFHETQLAAWQKKGWFEANGYDARGANARALGSLVTLAAAHDSRLVFVIVPESPRLRSALPVQAMKSLKASLEAAQELGPIEVLDLNAGLDETGFHDLVHENPRGRQASTRWIIDYLNGQYLGPGKP